MDRRPPDRRGTRVLIVEDGFAAIRALRTSLEGATGAGGERVASAQLADHPAALDRAVRIDADVVLIDANRHPNDRATQPGLSLLAGLEIAQRIQDERPATRVIAYSAYAHDPAVNIPFRELDVVDALYDVASLQEHMAEALWSTTFDHQVPLPTEADFAALGLLPGAQVWAAMQVVMARPDTWEAVARTQEYQVLEKRTREHLNIYLRPLLPSPSPVTYRHYLAVLRRVAGFVP